METSIAVVICVIFGIGIGGMHLSGYLENRDRARLMSECIAKNPIEACKSILDKKDTK